MSIPVSTSAGGSDGAGGGGQLCRACSEGAAPANEAKAEEAPTKEAKAEEAPTKEAKAEESPVDAANADEADTQKEKS